MREAKSKQIGDCVYTVNLLAVTPSLDLLVDIVKILGPSLAAVFGDLGALRGFLDKDVEDVKSEFLGTAITSMCEGLNKATLHSTIKTLASVTLVEIDGKTTKLAPIYEMHFATAGLSVLFQWVAFALTAQYDDFLGDLGSFVKLARLPAGQKQEKPSPSRPGVTG